MTAADLLAEASTQRTGVAGPELLESVICDEALVFVLDQFLAVFDYEEEMGSTTALASRILASYILGLRDVRSRLN